MNSPANSMSSNSSNDRRYTQLNDDELIYQYLNTKQNNYFSALYNRYVKKVYQRCLSITKDTDKAEDFTQDIFLRVYGNLANFKGNSSFSTWLYSISYNYCMDQLRRAKRNPTGAFDDSKEYAWFETPDGDNMEYQFQQLSLIMNSISMEEALILRLKYEEGLDIKTIALQFNVNDSAMKMRLKRSRDKIRQLYANRLN